MNIESTRDGEEIQFQLSDKMTFTDHQKFRDMLTEVSESRCTRCVIDLSRLDFIDSAGLGMLMIANDASERENWDLLVRHPRGVVRQVLELAEFGKVVRLEL